MPETDERPTHTDIVMLRRLTRHRKVTRNDQVGIVIPVGLRRTLGWDIQDQLLLQMTKAGNLIAKKI